MAQISVRIPDAAMAALRSKGSITEAVNAAIAEYLSKHSVPTERRITKRETRPDGWMPLHGDRVVIEAREPAGWYGCVVRVMRCEDDVVVCRRLKDGGEWSKAVEFPLDRCSPTDDPLTVMPVKKRMSRMVGRRVEVTDGEDMYRFPATIVACAGGGKYRIRTKMGKERVVPKDWLTIIG